jgi:DNA-binding response OmpR family regulator
LALTDIGGSKLSKPLALIVEDDFDLSTIFEQALKAANFETQVAQTGDAALIKLGDIVPDVVVLDLYLPGTSGADILKYIRSDARLAQTRVIITTSDARLAESLEDQADLVLVKPVNFGQLRDMASRLRPAS